MSDSHDSPAALADTAIAVAGALEAELEEALAAHRLTRASFVVLDALVQAPDGRLGQRALMAAVRRTSGTLSVRLRRLERAGLITREPDPEDRRSVTVALTGRGAKRLHAARPAYDERAERLAAGLPAGVAAPLADGLHGWLGFLEPGESTAPELGVAVAGAAIATRMRRAVGLPDEPGVLIVRVGTDSPAQAAGLARGDLITAAAGEAVQSIGDLHRAVRSAAGSLGLGVLRGAERRELTVALGPAETDA